MFDRQAYEQFLFDYRCIGFFDPPITLKSGRPGHWYVNMRDALESMKSLDTLANFVYACIIEENLRPDCFLGVPQGAVPLGLACNSLIDYKPKSEIPAAILRAEKKAHGDPKNRYTVGVLPPGSHVVLLEDVTTTGGSSMTYVLNLQQSGVYVDRVVSCVSRFERTERGRSVQDVLERDYHTKYSALTDARTLLPKALELLNPDKELIRDIEAYYEKYGVEPIKLKP